MQLTFSGCSACCDAKLRVMALHLPLHWARAAGCAAGTKLLAGHADV